MEQQDSNYCMIRGLAPGLWFRVEGLTVKIAVLGLGFRA